MLSFIPVFLSSLFGAGPRRIVVPVLKWIWLSTSFQRPFGILRRKFQQCDCFSPRTVTNANITNQICCRHKSDLLVSIGFVWWCKCSGQKVCSVPLLTNYDWLESNDITVPQSFWHCSNMFSVSKLSICSIDIFYLMVFGKVETTHFNFSRFIRAID